ncbi:hypothetical protein Btru_015241 [Bulinus truncatus]|nr:hypothetical protein Btru_015241 [Bulinus truncatus]
MDGVTMVGVTMVGVTMVGVTMAGVTMIGVTMVGVTMVGVTMIGVTMVGVTMAGVTMAGVTMVGVTMAGVTMVGVTMAGVTMVGVTMVDSTMIGVTMIGVTMVGVTMAGVTMVGVTMLGVTMAGVTMAGVTMVGVTMVGVTMAGVTMAGVTMAGVTMVGVTMAGVTMVGVTMVGVTMAGVTMVGVTMAGVTMAGVTMVGVTMVGVTMAGVTMAGVTMVGVTMAGVTVVSLCLCSGGSMFVDEINRSTTRGSRYLLSRFSTRRSSRNGWTLLHKAALSTPRDVYTAARAGVPINAQTSLGWHLVCLKTIRSYQPEHIIDATLSHCLVLFPEDNLTNWKKDLLQTLADVSFGNESSVLFGTVNTDSFMWPNGRSLNIGGTPAESSLLNSFLIFKHIKKDKTCLLLPATNLMTPSVVSFNFPSTLLPDILDGVILFINSNCHTFLNRQGYLNHAGIHRQHILENLFHVPKQDVYSPSSDSCITDPDGINICNSDVESDLDIKSSNEKYLNDAAELQKCERIHPPTSAQFFQDFVSLSKPVIITGATDHWPAFHKWSNDFLRRNFGNRTVHIKMTSDGIYEGVEPKSMWSDKSGKPIPQTVLEKLLYPDLVVVRPASMELLFSEFLDLVENVSLGKVKNMSAYLEYSTIADYFPELNEDISEMEFFKNVLELKHLNLWLSDGNTLGKLHFDPFDNFLCQISGEKELLLYEPHNNTRLYEAHIQEAKLSYDPFSHTFNRDTLLESTSMVMSPVDLSNPDFKRFPKFAVLEPLKCTIKAGEVLYMPAFWWHEVQSRPNSSEHRNLAVNYWYKPFLTREFPCPECQLDVNPEYFHLL